MLEPYLTYNPYVQTFDPNPTEKSIDTKASVSFVNPNTWTMLCMTSGLSKGTSPSSRIGDVIKCNRFEFRMNAYVASTVVGPLLIRIAVVLDKQNNKGQTTALQCWQDDDYQSFYDLSNRQRFVVLFDKLYPGIENGGETALFDHVVLDLDFETIFRPDAFAGPQDVVTNCLYLCYTAVDDFTAGVPFMQLWSRLVFTDR